MSIVVMRPGLLSTIQDRGRTGYRHLGIRPCGVMDPVAARVANLLVGNTEDAAVLEMTLLGPILHFLDRALISLAGADFQATLDGEPILNNAPHWIKAGQVLELKQAVRGCRGYLAVEDGFGVLSILGSSSTDSRSGWGGFKGRALETADVLVNSSHWNIGVVKTNWSIELPVEYSEDEHTIPIIRGSEANWFTNSNWEALLHTPYMITPQSDRMGYRLQGEDLSIAQPRELLSSASLRGNIQVPADGQPILLMADHPTTGGYPVIATVATAAWPILAQARPGDQLRFVEISRAEGRQLFVQQANAIKKLSRGIEAFLGKRTRFWEW